MKHFSLKEYLKNPARKVVTREGNSVEIIYTNAEGRYPIVAVVTNKEGNKVTIKCTKYGLWSENGESALDLFFEPIKKEGWINVCRGCGEYNTYVCNRIFATKEEAQREKRDIIATLKIEWEGDNGED